MIDAETRIEVAGWPSRVAIEGLEVARETLLKGAFLTVALGALMVDILASLWLAGRLVAPGAGRTTSALLALALVGSCADSRALRRMRMPLRWRPRPRSCLPMSSPVTGLLDQTAQAGLRGLSQVLFERTSIEPAEPIAVDLETDELAFFPILYWPVTQDQPIPSGEAYAKLNTYLRSGGMIVFDTRDANVASFGGGSATGRRLQELARPLDIPPLEPVPDDHVLTRTFYLLQDFPGRHASRDVWVEAAPPDAERIDGMPFRNLNDNVTPVVIGGNDWASAWAVDESGRPMFPVGRGFSGERQREISYRFGVNLIMHVLTGNYKSDQVHVPALLDRLGQ